jgi:hypothetical protein
MTVQKSFKRLVRTRMEKTGESYTAARASLLAAVEQPAVEPPALATSDEEIRRRTGRGWEEWFDLLDEWGAPDRRHREKARWLAEQQGADPLAWNVQAVVSSYERARGLREVGEKDDGTFSISATRTVAVPVERLYDAFPADGLRERTATRPRSARFDWGDNGSRLAVAFTAKGDTKSAVSVQHERLGSAAEAERMKAHWRERLTALKEELEGGDDA